MPECFAFGSLNAVDFDYSFFYFLRVPSSHFLSPFRSNIERYLLAFWILPFAFCVRSRCLPLFIMTFVHFLSPPSLFRALNKFVQIVVNGECSVCVCSVCSPRLLMYSCARVCARANEENCHRRIWIYAIVTLWRVVGCAARTIEMRNNMRLLLMPQSSFPSRLTNENNVWKEQWKDDFNSLIGPLLGEIDAACPEKEWMR